ncbi:substrate-binding domain-containing protein [Microbacterium sp. YY-01]|uniref:substrate-binding domain-containing protein n=1 Tax=Microbacterium sp. YY-01 TaxID=3421634 RepID=UPI003D17B057
MSRTIRTLLATVAATAMAASLVACTAADDNDTNGGNAASADAPSVVLSNAYIGNSWRQSMVNTFETSAKQAQEDGLISSFKVSNAPGENSATDQIAQIKSILLESPDILLINPASPTALSPVIAQACAQDITVVVFDSGVESDCAYVVTNSFPEWAKVATENVVDAMGGEGNLLISRGVVGSDPEAQFFAAQEDVLADFPDINVVGEVKGFCSSAEAQKAVVGVLSSLPEIDGVAGCGDGFGIAQAFQSAGRDIPAVAFEPSGRALRFWAENDVAAGSIAIMSDPGQSVAALFVALAIRDGVDVPQTTVFPSVLILEEDRDTWIDAVGDDEIASWPWTKDLVDTYIQANIDDTVEDAPLPPVPTKG